jgi:hypothetical protein
MENLVDDLNVAFHKARNKGVSITNPSIPILYFGDLTKYLESEIKIITVGLNPSHIEFPEYSRFTRFADAESLDTTKKWSKSEVATYLQSLNDYFKHNPYSWFDSFEPVLNGLNASYYPTLDPNTAIHTDLCSPFATDITWSKLSVRNRNVLRADGIPIWHRLTEILKPDMTLVSIARMRLKSIKFRASTWKKFTSIYEKKDGTPRSKPYDIEVAKSQIGDKNGHLVFGPAAQKPFGTLSTGHKRIVGGRLLDLFD